MVKELPIESLRKTCDPRVMRCKTTRELVPLSEIIGQERAVRALKFGLGIRDQGFNIYVAGYPGTGRKTAVKNFVEECASAEPVPPDLCYVNNFSNQYQPDAIQLPPGKASDFQGDVKNLIESIRTTLPKAFESDDYAARREATIRVLEKQRKALIDKLNAKAQQEGFIIQSTPIGLLLIPVVNGKPLKEEELLSLPQKTKDLIQEKRSRLESELRNTMRQFRDMERKIREELKKLNREVALYAIGNLVEDLIEKYKALPEITAYLKSMQNDILDNIEQFVKKEEAQQRMPFPTTWMKEASFRKYEVNVIVDNSDVKGAPVVTEFNPTYQNLFGTTEKEAQFGVLTTDFTMIRGGSLHRANGGYLVLPIEELLRNLFSYESLKRAVTNESITIEEPGERMGFITTKGLKYPLKDDSLEWAINDGLSNEVVTKPVEISVKCGVLFVYRIE